MKSIVNRLQTEEFPRIRIGTGICEDKENLINYVIKKVSNEEYLNLISGIDLATKAIGDLLKDGIDNTMNRYN